MMSARHEHDPRPGSGSLFRGAPEELCRDVRYLTPTECRTSLESTCSETLRSSTLRRAGG